MTRDGNGGTVKTVPYGGIIRIQKLFVVAIRLGGKSSALVLGGLAGKPRHNIQMSAIRIDAA